MSSPSSPLPILPFDILVEILCCLPVKLLLQLRCLCKSINTLISDPKFIKKHLRISTSSPRLLLFSGNLESYERSYPLHSNFNTVSNNATRLNNPFTDYFCSLENSCDGMFCLEFEDSIILWNPSIQKFKTLPSLDLGASLNIGDDPAFSFAFGFGFDASIDNYKVVCVLGITDLDVAKIKVHILGTDSWRTIPGDYPVPTTMWLKFTSGTLNWFASNDNSVVSFDLMNESYRKILPPNDGGKYVDIVTLDVLRGCLSIFAQSQMFTSVWMMKEYGNEDSWTQLFRISRTENPFYDLYAKPIWISNDDRVLMKKKEYISGSWKMNFAICDFKNGAFKIQSIQSMNGWFSPEVYVESLVSPCL